MSDRAHGRTRRPPRSLRRVGESLKHIWEGPRRRPVLSFQTLALARAIMAAKADKTIWWVADVRTAAAFIEGIGGVPDADRARLIEHAAESPCVLGLV